MSQRIMGNNITSALTCVSTPLEVVLDPFGREMQLQSNYMINSMCSEDLASNKCRG